MLPLAILAKGLATCVRAMTSVIPKMEKALRLTSTQIQAIIKTLARLADETAEVFLFGSRLNDQARGGDVDLLIETNTPLTLIERAQLKIVEDLVGLPVDIIVQTRNAMPTPFQRIARANAVKLEA